MNLDEEIDLEYYVWFGAGGVGAEWISRQAAWNAVMASIASVCRDGSAAQRVFHSGWIKSVRLPRPVISIGNLTVGGTGKTPTCLWLAGELRHQGLKVAIQLRIPAEGN